MTVNASHTLLATDPLRNASVHASAGTGKTWLLVTRILRLLLAGSRPDSILAVTFTRKAAAEMEQRVMERLHGLMCADDAGLDSQLVQAGLTPDVALRERARQLYEAVLRNPRRLRSTTFHAFCQELLQRFPLEAGIAPGFAISEATGLLEQEARDAVLARTAQTPDGELAAHLATLVDGCNGLFNARHALGSFLAHRSDWWAWTRDAHDPVAFACDALANYLDIEPAHDPLAGFPETVLREQLAEFAALLGDNSTKTNLQHAERLSRALAGTREPAAFMARITPVFLTKGGTPLSRKANKAQCQRLGAQREARFLELHELISVALLKLNDAVMRRANWRTGRAWYHAGAQLLADYQRIKGEQRLLDFADLEWRACELLNRSEHASWVQYKLDARIEHLLVDEFQDTNPTQWQLLKPLLEELAGGLDERRRSVFLVGDKKQSIYGFRRANPALLEAASSWLETHMQAQRYPLDASRRSAQAIMDCVNAVFAQPALVERMSDFNAHTTHLPELYGHVELLPLQTSTAEEPVEQALMSGKALRNPLLEPRAVAEDARYAAEGRLIAGYIQRFVAEGRLVENDDRVRALDYGDIMILLRQRTHAHAYETALRDAGIPFQSASKGLLLENLEIRDMVALLNCLISPFDNLALAQVLRSPLFGLTSEQLVPLAGDNSQYWYERLAAFGQAGSPPYRAVHAQLEHWRELAGQIPVHDLLDRIFHEGEVVQRYEAAFPAALLPRLRASLTRFIELALEIDNGRYPSLPRFLDQLQRLHRSDGDQPDDSTPDDDGSTRVRLLTIHSAKGLEAPVVFLADAAAATRNRNAHSAVLDWPHGDDRANIMLLAGSREQQDAVTRELLERQVLATQQEDDNLLYVALTRARQYLFISGCRGKQQSGTWYDLISDALKDWPRTADGHPYRESGRDQMAAELPPNEAMPADVDPRLSRTVRTRIPLIRIAPSRAESAEAVITGGDSDGRERGIMLHAMLDALSREDRVNQATVQQAVAARLQRDPLDADFRACWQIAVDTVGHPDLAGLFDSSRYRQALNEVPVQYLDDQRLVYGVIDRLIIDDDTVTVIDYKTHMDIDAGSIRTLVEQYRPQMAYYHAAVTRLWPQHVIRSGLLFTDSAQLIWLDGLQSAVTEQIPG